MSQLPVILIAMLWAVALNLTVAKTRQVADHWPVIRYRRTSVEVWYDYGTDDDLPF